MTTTILSSLKVIARPKIEPKNPIIGKRLKLIDRLDEQAELVQCLLEGKPYEAYRERTIKDPQTGERKKVRKPKVVRPWYYDSDDHYYFEVRIGTQPIELQKGKPAIDVGEKAKLPEVIETLTKAVEKGELDTFLLAAQGPKKKAKPVAPPSK